MRSLREIFAERKELIAKYVPPETQAIHAQAVAELKASTSRGKHSCLWARRHQSSSFRITMARSFLLLICSRGDGLCSASSAGAGARSASGRWRR